MASDRREWTADDLAALPEDLWYEVVDGRLITSSPTPFDTFVGGRVADAVNLQRPPQFRLAVGEPMRLDPWNEPRPDVVVLPATAPDRWAPDDVILIVDIIGTHTSLLDGSYKIHRLYAAAGIPACWVIETSPERIMVTEYLLGADGRYAATVQSDGRTILTRPYDVILNLPGFTKRRDEMGARPPG